MRRYLIYFPLLFLMVSCEIIEEDISGRAVTTIAPANDAEVPAGSVMFRWRAVDRATGYELCVATEGRIVAETLRQDYPDPFLKGVAAPKPDARSVVRRLPPAGKAEPKRRERVQLSHLATVTAGGQALHILTIGGRQYELSLRDTAAGFRLTGADRDSLYLEREGTVYGVKRCDE